MRLESQDQTPPRESAARGGQHGGHFGRMVAVIIDQGVMAATVCGTNSHFAIALETPADTSEFGQCVGNGRIGQFEFTGYGNGGQGIAHIVFAGEVERDGQISRTGLPRDELHLPAGCGMHVGGAQISVGAKAIGGDGPRQHRQHGAHASIVTAQHGAAIKRQAVDEFDKCAA